MQKKVEDGLSPIVVLGMNLVGGQRSRVDEDRDTFSGHEYFLLEQRKNAEEKMIAGFFAWTFIYSPRSFCPKCLLGFLGCSLCFQDGS
mmetsp:Transcript_16257/g.67255  ORF Transcript_16257/g.67255 Transcript_16257/m.67255 type:complete len:88 (-) Transcript_16257:625-888(-)